MSKFSWLHLTDLHYGMGEQKWLWPNIKDLFFEDLKKLHGKSGPWDVVFFTGDLVQRGASEEFDGLNTLLDTLWKLLKELGPEPLLIPVPGNHDLVRPNSEDAEVLLLTKWEQNKEIHKKFWENPKSKYRKVISKAFTNYSNWLDTSPLTKSLEKQNGLLPGDLSYTYEKGDLKIGIIGLNTAFLQLAAGDYTGQLALSQRQFHAVCDGDGPEWLKQHSASLLLTHHPLNWLNDESKEEYVEITQSGRFAAHLFGHMHEHNVDSLSVGGGPTRRYLQGCSLFGLELYGEDTQMQRSHGYSSGQIEVNDGIGSIRLWPRIAQKHKVGGWKIIPDHINFELNDEVAQLGNFTAKTFSSEGARHIISLFEETPDPKKFIGRENEKELFEEVLKATTPTRILAITDKGGEGKSDLLKQFARRCRVVEPLTPFSLTVLDQYEAPYTPLLLIKDIAAQLSLYGITFNNYEKNERARLDADFGATNSDSIDVSTATDVPTATNPLSPEQEQAAQDEVINSFFHELHEYCATKPVVLMIDSFDKGKEGFKDWFVNRFLRRNFFSPSCTSCLLVLVIAGKEVPEFYDIWPQQVCDSQIILINKLGKWTRENVLECLRAHGNNDPESYVVDSIYGEIKKGRSLETAVGLCRTFSGFEDTND